jgi:hypothetical protein
VANERDLANRNQGDFRPEGSRAMALMLEKYPVGMLTRNLVLSFCDVLSGVSGIRLPRDLKRRRALLLKWLEDHYDKLKAIADLMELPLNS